MAYLVVFKPTRKGICVLVRKMSNIILYHGSRSGITGAIKPSSREKSDFGRGFYMGTNIDQARALVANAPSPHLYHLSVNLDGVSPDRILYLQDMDWAYFVLYNRGHLETVAGSEFYKKYEALGDEKDFIIGPIADDAMNETMSRFMHNQITDKAFLESIRALDFGIQYVAKTTAACGQITILQEKALFGKELEDSMLLSNTRRREGRKVAEDVQRKFRREGDYLDEILSKIQMEIGLEDSHDNRGTFCL